MAVDVEEGGEAVVVDYVVGPDFVVEGGCGGEGGGGCTDADDGTREGFMGGEGLDASGENEGGCHSSEAKYHGAVLNRWCDVRH